MQRNIIIFTVVTTIVLVALAELSWLQRSVVSEAEVQAALQTETTSRLQETTSHLQETEGRYQAVLAEKLGAQAQLRLNDTIDPTLGTLLATESVTRFQSIEGDIAIRRGIELMSWREVLTVNAGWTCIRSMSLSDDGQRLAIYRTNCRYQEQDVAVEVWDVNTQQQLFRFAPEYDEHLYGGDISMSSDGQWLVIHRWSGDLQDHTIKLIALDTGQEVVQADSLAWGFSPNSQAFALINKNNTVSIWDLSILPVQPRPIPNQKAFGLTFNPDNQRLALINTDNTVLIWDISTQQLLTQLPHDQKVSGVSFSPDGQWMAVQGEDKVWLWNAETYQLAQEISQKDAWLRYSPDSSFLAIVANKDYMVHIWELATGTEITQVAFNHPIRKVEFNSDSRWLAALTITGDVHVWEIPSHLEVTRISLGSNSNSTMTFSRDSHWLATSTTRGKTQIWETSSWRESARMAQGGDILIFSLDSQWLTSSGDSYGATVVWKLEPGPETARFLGASEFSRLAFNHSNQWIAALKKGEGSKNIRVWDIATGEEIAQSEISEVQLASFVFNSDGQLKMVENDPGTIVISDTITGQEVSRMICGEVAKDILDFNQGLMSPSQTIAFNAHNELLAIGGVLKNDKSYKNMVWIWDISKCQEKKQLLHNYTIAKVIFSPNSQLLAVGTSQIDMNFGGLGEVRIWSVATGHEVSFINSGQVESLFFSPDSRWLVVNGTRILEANTGREVARIPNRFAYQAVFSSDSRWLATAVQNYISIWAWQPADMVAQACARLTRNLTQEEWHQYLAPEPYRATCSNLPISQN